MIVAAVFAQKHEIVNLEGLVDFNLESLVDVIPAGIVKDAKQITVSIIIRAVIEQERVRAEADADSFPCSKMSAKLSTTTLLQWDFMSSPRVSGQSIL